MTKYKSWRPINGKPRWIIVGDSGNIINKIPNKEELKGLEVEPYKKHKYCSVIYMANEGRRLFCNRCNMPFEDSGHGAHYNEKINGKWTGRKICHKCYSKDRNRLTDSHNNMKKEFNMIDGKSKQRTEDNCIICNKDLNSIPTTSWNHPMKQYINNEWTKHWLCNDCWYETDYKLRSDTKAKIIKYMRDRRLGTLKDLGNILGDNCEELTKELFGVKRLSTELDKYSRLPNDHSPIPEGVSIEIAGKLIDLSGKVPQTTGRCLDDYGTWDFGNLKREWNKDFDIEVCWCISKDRLSVERGYIFMKKDIYNSETKEGVNRIHITKNPTDAYGNSVIPAYEPRAISDNALLNRANEKWKDIIKENNKDKEK